MRTINAVVCGMAVLLLLSCAPGVRADILANVEEIKDTRTTGRFFAGLDVKLRVMGELPQGARAVRFLPGGARDDLGTDLLKEAEPGDFAELNKFNFDNGQISLEVQLKNPLRRAKYLEELTGKLELFVPSRDENAVLTVPNFRQRVEPAVVSEKLRRANVTLSVLTAEQYEKLKKSQLEGNGNGGEALGEAFAQAFGALFGGLAPAGRDSVILQCADPDSVIVSFEFLDAAGARLESQGRMSMGDFLIFDFPEKLPAGAQMKVYIKTAAAVVSYPLTVKNAALP